MPLAFAAHARNPLSDKASHALSFGNAFALLITERFLGVKNFLAVTG